jgi:hypothetical protein
MTFDNVSTTDYKKFALRLVHNDYALGENDALSTNLVFSSDWINPRLHLIENYFFKANYLSNILANEIRKYGFSITPSTIKNRVIKASISAYHASISDETSGRDVDFIFFIDTKTFKAFVFKRDPELAANQKKLYSTEKKVLKASEVSVDKYFYNAFNFLGVLKSASGVIKESDINKIIKTERAYIEVIISESGEKIGIAYDKTETALDLQKANEYIVKIISDKKPLIETKLDFIIRNKEKELFKSTGEIVRERSIKHKELYELNVKIGFHSEEKIKDAKALLVYLKNLKENRHFNKLT